MPPSDTQVLIIGAGPYGIAVAQELWHRGLEPVVVGEPFETWHRHTLDLMDLRSDPRGSSVFSPDGRYSFPDFLQRARGAAADDAAAAEDAGAAEDGAAADEETVPVLLYRRYLRDVTQSLPFPLVRGLVERLELPQPGRFVARVDARDGAALEITARSVVVATGLGAHRHLPAVFDTLPRECLLHSWDVDAIQRLDGRRVLVVGGGQSSAETVADLRRRNRVTWAVKRPPLFFREPLRVPTPIFKLMLAGSSWIFRLPPPLLRTLSRAVFRTTITPRLEPVWRDAAVAKLLSDAEGLRLEAAPRGGKITDGEAAPSVRCGADGETYDAVVSATGYRFSVAGLPFLSPALAAQLRTSGDPPELGSDFSSTVPGLYFVGGIAESTHGPAMRFVIGARHAAKTLGRTLPDALGGGVDPATVARAA